MTNEVFALYQSVYVTAKPRIEADSQIAVMFQDCLTGYVDICVRVTYLVLRSALCDVISCKKMPCAKRKKGNSRSGASCTDTSRVPDKSHAPYRSRGKSYPRFYGNPFISHPVAASRMIALHHTCTNHIMDTFKSRQGAGGMHLTASLSRPKFRKLEGR